VTGRKAVADDRTPHDAVSRGLHRLLVEEREKDEIEMRRGMAGARLAVGDVSVSVGEVYGDPYNLIAAIKDVRGATRLGLRESKAFVDAYRWDRHRTIEAAREYASGRLPEYLELKPKMSAKECRWLLAEIEAEPEIERYRCKRAQLYLYLTTRSTRHQNMVAYGR
jgi:hypothetical protein